MNEENLQYEWSAYKNSSRRSPQNPEPRLKILRPRLTVIVSFQDAFYYGK